MFAWLFERKIFSPTISDPSTFFMKKIGDAKFYIHRQHKI